MISPVEDTADDAAMRSERRNVGSLSRPWTVVALAVALLAGSVAQLHAWGMPRALTLVLAPVQTVPLVWATRRPLTAWTVVAAGLAISTWSGYGQGRLGWPWPAGSCVVLLISVCTVALHRGRRTGIEVAAVTAAVVVVPAVFAVPLPVGVVVLAVAVVAGALVFGDSLRTRREAQRDLHGESGRRAALEERSRIAREMHDVVAHHLSLIALQSEAAAYQIPGLPEAAQARFELLRAMAGEGLAEMRRLLGVLRDDESAPLQPVPRLTELPALVDSSRRAGVAVDLAVAGCVRGLPAGVEVAAYRIVQEALSNSARHAPGGPVHVEVDYGTEWLRVRVRNAPPHAHRSPDEPAASGGGYGLAGMHERVTGLGGTLSSSPEPGGGFLVDAALPVHEWGRCS